MFAEGHGYAPSFSVVSAVQGCGSQVSADPPSVSETYNPTAEKHTGFLERIHRSTNKG